MFSGMSSGSIRSLDVEGFRSIKRAKLELGPVNVLIGPNGSGKSNLLAVFKLLNELTQERLGKYVGALGGAWSLLHRGRDRARELALAARFDSDTASNTYRARLERSDDDRLYFASEEVELHTFARQTEPPFRRRLREGGFETSLVDAAQSGESTAKFVLGNIKRWRVYHFHETGRESALRRTADLRDSGYLFADGGNLPAYLFRLKRDERRAYDRVLSAVRRIAPFFDDFVLRPLDENDSIVPLRWRSRESDEEFHVGYLSDGTLRFIALAAVLLQPKPPHTIVIDEPELGLHPAAISEFVEMMLDRSADVQFVVSTQSVTLLNQLSSPEQVIVVDREQGQTVFRKHSVADLTEWLKNYSLGDLWLKNVLGGRP